MREWIDHARVRAAIDHAVIRLIVAQPRVASHCADRLGDPIPVPIKRCVLCGRGTPLR